MAAPFDQYCMQDYKILAEREGFEPSLEFPLNTLSKRAPSTTRPSLRKGCSTQSTAAATHNPEFSGTIPDSRARVHRTARRAAEVLLSSLPPPREPHPAVRCENARTAPRK